MVAVEDGLLQLLLAGVGHRPLGAFRYLAGLFEPNTPIQKQTQLYPHGVEPVFMTTKLPFGMDFSSSGVMRGRSIIWSDWLGSFFPVLIDPLMTVRLPKEQESCSAV